MSLEKQQFAFGDFILDADERVLLKAGTPVSITPKVFQLLLVLIKNQGHLVEKQALMDSVWAGSFVEESNLTFTIRQLRKALGDDKQNPRFIETVPRRGYRFIAEVSSSEETSNDRGISRPATVSSGRRYVLWSVIAFLLVVGLAAMTFRFASTRLGQEKQPKFTMLTSTGRVTNAVLSNDAKYLVFSQKEEGGEGLWLRQILTGSQTRILAPRDVEYTGLAVSPDNEFVYCSVFFKNKVDVPLWRVPILGGPVTELPNVFTSVAVSFAPDGKRFTYTESFSAARETQVKISNADGSNQSVLLHAKAGERHLPTFHSNPVAWSPDGETIACAIEESNENGSFTRIFGIDPDDGKESLISEKQWNYIENVVWIDNDSLAVVADEADSPFSHVWSVSRDGTVRQLTSDLNSYWLLASAHGNLLTIQKSQTSSLQVAPYDVGTKTLKPAEILNESGSIDYVRWSKDNAILYTSRASGRNDIWRMQPDGSDLKRLTTDANVTYGFALSRGDNSLVFSSARNGKNSLWLADSEGQNFHELTNGTEDCVPNVTIDGHDVIFQGGYGKEAPTIYRISIADNQIRTKLTDRFSVHPSLSPDGTKIAFQFMDSLGSTERKWKIGIISSQDGRFITTLNMPVTISERAMEWHPHGDFLTQVAYVGEQVNFVLLPINGAESKTIEGAGKGRIASFAWSPGGDQIVFSQITETQDAILLSDF